VWEREREKERERDWLLPMWVKHSWEVERERERVYVSIYWKGDGGEERREGKEREWKRRERKGMEGMKREEKNREEKRREEKRREEKRREEKRREKRGKEKRREEKKRKAKRPTPSKHPKRLPVFSQKLIESFRECLSGVEGWGWEMCKRKFKLRCCTPCKHFMGTREKSERKEWEKRGGECMGVETLEGWWRGEVKRREEKKRRGEENREEKRRGEGRRIK
jgi:hypothetical protein